MSTFKKFTDFCTGLALFAASLFLFREFMAFSPEGDPALRERWALFLENTEWRDYRPYLGLIALLALSLLVGILLRRWPSVCFVFAAFPFLKALSMLRDGCLYERPMLYLLFGTLPLAGNLFDALQRDRDDGRHHAFVLASVSSLLVFAFFVLMLWRLDVTAEVANIYEESRFDQKIGLAATDTDLSFWRQYARLYAVSIVVSLAFCGAYWLDVIFAALPLVFAFKRQIMGTLGPHNELILALMILCFVCRLALMVAGTGWKRKECRSNEKHTQKPHA